MHILEQTNSINDNMLSLLSPVVTQEAKVQLIVKLLEINIGNPQHTLPQGFSMFISH